MTYPIKYNKSLVSLEGMRRPKELIIKTPGFLYFLQLLSFTEGRNTYCYRYNKMNTS